uniref:Uncharacterized protein n=1 Tax=Globodera rostochiensis TaxID=31243 RepID=A0A914GW11_GLORO
MGTQAKSRENFKKQFKVKKRRKRPKSRKPLLKQTPARDVDINSEKIRLLHGRQLRQIHAALLCRNMPWRERFGMRASIARFVQTVSTRATPRPPGARGQLNVINQTDRN